MRYTKWDKARRDTPFRNWVLSYTTKERGGIYVFAYKMGVTPQGVYSWFKGKTSPPMSTAVKFVQLGGGAFTLENIARETGAYRRARIARRA